MRLPPSSACPCAVMSSLPVVQCPAFICPTVHGRQSPSLLCLSCSHNLSPQDHSYESSYKKPFKTVAAAVAASNQCDRILLRGGQVHAGPVSRPGMCDTCVCVYLIQTCVYVCVCVCMTRVWVTQMTRGTQGTQGMCPIPI